MGQNHSLRLIFFVAASCLALSMIACWSEPDPVDPPSTPTQNNVSFDDNCGSEDKPCYFSEVSDEVLESSLMTMLEAQILVEQGKSSSEVAQWLKDEGALNVDHNLEYVAFRYAGGMRMYIRIKPSFGDIDADGANAEEDSRPNGLIAFDPVRGREQKAALVLAPYDWEFSEKEQPNESAKIKTFIEDVPGFDGAMAIHVKPNAKANLEAFTTFNNYDLVHISTHGACFVKKAGEPCYDIGLMVGKVLDETMYYRNYSDKFILESESVKSRMKRLAALLKSSPDYKKYKGLAVNVHLAKKEEMIEGKVVEQTKAVFMTVLRPPFFKQVYPTGLKNKLIYVDACQSSSSAANALQLALLGQSSAYLGWSEPVDAEESIKAVELMYEQMGKYGFGAKQALANIGDAAIDKISMPNARLLYRSSNDANDVRIREVITVLDPNDLPGSVENIVPLLDRSDLGIIQEGDKLKISAVVEGITKEQLNKTSLSVWLDNKQIGETYALKDHGELFDDMRGDAYLIKGILVDPGQLFGEGALVDLEVRLQLPEGGESIDVVRELSGSKEACFGTFAAGTIRYTSPEAEKDKQRTKFGQITANNPFETQRKTEVILQSQDLNAPQEQLVVYSPNVFTGPGQYPVTLIASLEGDGVSKEYVSRERQTGEGAPSGIMTIEWVKGSGSSRLVKGTIIGSVYEVDENGMLKENAISATSTFILPIDDQTLDPNDMSRRLYDVPKWNEVCDP